MSFFASGTDAERGLLKAQFAQNIMPFHLNKNEYSFQMLEANFLFAEDNNTVRHKLFHIVNDQTILR